MVVGEQHRVAAEQVGRVDEALGLAFRVEPGRAGRDAEPRVRSCIDPRREVQGGGPRLDPARRRGARLAAPYLDLRLDRSKGGGRDV